MVLLLWFLEHKFITWGVLNKILIKLVLETVINENWLKKFGDAKKLVLMGWNLTAEKNVEYNKLNLCKKVQQDIKINFESYIKLH